MNPSPHLQVAIQKNFTNVGNEFSASVLERWLAQYQEQREDDKETPFVFEVQKKVAVNDFGVSTEIATVTYSICACFDVYDPVRFQRVRPERRHLCSKLGQLSHHIDLALRGEPMPWERLDTFTGTPTSIAKMVRIVHKRLQLWQNHKEIRGATFKEETAPCPLHIYHVG